jgi:hypothetical protein
MKAFTLTLIDGRGCEIDSTTIHAENRPSAVENAKRLLLFQGLSGYKYRLKLKR